MPAGLRVTGTHTVLQIDETYRNLVFKSKGTVTLNGAVSGTSLYGNNFTVTSTLYPFIAVRSSSKVTFTGFTKSGANYTMYYMSDTNGASVDWYHFDAPATGETTNYLAIFDAAGELVYNALAKAKIVVDSKVPNSTYTGTSGRKYAGMQNIQGYSERERAPTGMGTGSFQSWQPYQSWSTDINGSFQGTTYATAMQIQNTAVGTVDRDNNGPNVKFIIVDVTGL